MPQQKILRLILGDQLDELHSWFKTPDKNVTYVMMEIRQETDYVKHHIQKVAAFFAAMRAFSARLNELGHKVIYIRLDDRQNKQTIAANLQQLLADKKFARVETIKKFTLIDILLTTDDDEITPTMKLKRKFVNEKFKDAIEAMY